MSMDSSKSVLVVDDEPGMRAALAANFQRDGWVVETAAGVTEAMRRLAGKHYSVLVTDVQMPDGNGLQLMTHVRNCSPKTVVIVLTAYGTVPDAVSAIQSGACNYLTKPVSFEQLRESIQRARKGENTSRSNKGATGAQILGNSPSLQRCLERAQHAARANADVLIEAESGSGKELLARYIHEMSDRRDKPFVAVNCAAVPEHLLESELFGHAKGAFTGAIQNRTGKFGLAEGGTLLLDEIGEMPLSLQPKLLRALQERQFEPLGDTKTYTADIRIIATTNVSLLEMVGQGEFRADLYYRLNVIPLSVPPLRQRRDDIPLLIQHFAEQFCSQAGKNVPEFSQEFINGMVGHDWPGNVRELANFIRRVVTLDDSAVIDVGWLTREGLCPNKRFALVGDPLCPNKRFALVGDPLHSLSSSAPLPAPANPGMSMREIERNLLLKTLESTQGNRTHAAKILGMSLRTVRNRIREYGLPPRSYALR